MRTRYLVTILPMQEHIWVNKNLNQEFTKPDDAVIYLELLADKFDLPIFHDYSEAGGIGCDYRVIITAENI